MVITALDTHEMVKEFTLAGFNGTQAEALTKALRLSQDIDLSTLATKQDLQAGLAAAKADLTTATANLERSIAESRADIIKWTMGTVGMQSVLLIGALVALVRMTAR